MAELDVVGVAVADVEGVFDPETPPGRVTVGDPVTVVVGVPDVDTVDVPVPVREGVTEPEPVVDKLTVGVLVGVLEGVGVGLAIAPTGNVVVGDKDGETLVGVALAVPVAVNDGVADELGVPVGVADGLTLGVTEGLGVSVVVEVGVADGEADTEVVADEDSVGARVLLGDDPADREAVGELELEQSALEGVAEGVKVDVGVFVAGGKSSG